jgi:hypothetical protein
VRIFFQRELGDGEAGPQPVVITSRQTVRDGVKGLRAALMAGSRLKGQKHDYGLTYVDS